MRARCSVRCSVRCARGVGGAWEGRGRGVGGAVGLGALCSSEASGCGLGAYACRVDSPLVVPPVDLECDLLTPGLRLLQGACRQAG